MKNLKFYQLVLFIIALVPCNSMVSQCLIHNTELGYGHTGGIVPTDDEGDPQFDYSSIAAANGTLFFGAVDQNNGTELWKIDGTTNEVILVKDINPGKFSSYPEQITEFNGLTIFSAVSELGRELWVSNGTEEGTVLLKDIQEGSGSSTPSELVDNGSLLFFTAYDEINGRQLWKTDGTTEGTQIVKIQDDSFIPLKIIACGSKVYLTAKNELNGRELWTTDGTAAGTNLVKDIQPGTSGSSPNSITCYKDGIVFSAWQDGFGKELWTSDGTEAGTFMIKDINPGNDSSEPNSFTKLGDKILFSADSPLYGKELWISDGTATGTQLLIDINEGLNGSSPIWLVEYNSKVYFSASDLTNGNQLWVTDGTTSGTTVFMPAAGISNPGKLLVYGSYLYFLSGDSIWRTDGTTSGTINISDKNPSIEIEYPSALTGVEDNIYFIADDYDHGYEIWRHNINDLSLQLTKDINKSRNGLSLTTLNCSDNDLYYLSGSYRSYLTGYTKLWSTDGTAAGLTQVVEPGGSLASIKHILGKIGSSYYFAGFDYTNGVELWKSDGTELGTMIVKDINPGKDDALISSPKSVINDVIYFSSNDGVNGVEPWVSDGTSAGTFLLKDINTGLEDSTPSDFTGAGSLVYFEALYGYRAVGLWVTNGTPGGTILLRDGYAHELTAIGSKLLFIAGDDITGKEMWVSDGTANGTHILKDIAPGPENSRPSKIVVSGNTGYFLTNTDSVQLWKTDGTNIGTTLVSSEIGIYPKELTAVGDLLFFKAKSNNGDYKLWVSDGTAQGTFALTKPKNPSNITASDTETHIYFTRYDYKASGSEIWFSDGTNEGTYKVRSPSECNRIGGASNLKVWNNELYYMGRDGSISRTGLYKLNCIQTGCTTTIEENEWDGPMTGDWHTTPSYWTPGALPGICDDVIIPSGYEVTVSSCEPALSHTLDVKKGAIFNVLIGAELEVNCKK